MQKYPELPGHILSIRDATGVEAGMHFGFVACTAVLQYRAIKLKEPRNLKIRLLFFMMVRVYVLPVQM